MDLDDKLKQVQIEKFEKEAAKIEAETKKILEDQAKENKPYYKKPTFLQNFVAIIASFTFLGFYIDSIILPIAETKNITLAHENAVAQKKVIEANDSLIILRKNIDTLYKTYEDQYNSLIKLQKDYVVITKQLNKEKDELIKEKEKLLADYRKSGSRYQTEIVSLEESTKNLKANSTSTFDKVSVIENSLKTFGILNYYKIEIFCQSNQLNKARKVKSLLLNEGFQGLVKVSTKGEAFFDQVGSAHDHEVRYEQNSKEERALAEKLVEILNKHAQKPFTIRTVSTPTPKYLSIFIPSDSSES
jgi:hypothetical protein